ncbi:MAG: branched-chain amino acid ABC transporter permease [Betaproteobacteria bacterium]|nr:branched-chain amino acid ABC transporter permease [Betaproteobacteria bacterium]
MQLTINIVVLAAIYALICCGYVLIYRVSRVMSLAHGELMMLGAYGLFATAGTFSGHPLIAIAVAAVLATMVGVLVYVALMRSMTGEAVLAAVLATIALGIFLRGAMVLVWSAQEQHPIRLLGWTNSAVSIGETARISAAALVLVVVTALAYLSLYFFLKYTVWGIRMRAAGQNPLLAAQRGIGLHGIYALAWALATFTGGIAGMLIASDTALDQTMIIIGLKAFPAALVGGLDSLLGALIGSLIVAAAEVLMIHYIDPLLADVVPFFVLLVFLIVRPWGLYGSKEELDRV